MGYDSNEGDDEERTDSVMTWTGLLDNVGIGCRLSIFRYLNRWIGDEGGNNWCILNSKWEWKEYSWLLYWKGVVSGWFVFQAQIGGMREKWNRSWGLDSSGVGKKSYSEICLWCKVGWEFGWDISDHYVVMCEVKLVLTWIKMSKMVNVTGRIRYEKLRE